jgi:PhnB protein
MQRITPYLYYEDVAAAIEWLTKAFGFKEMGERISGADGKVNHAAMELEGAVIMMGYPGPEYRNPKRLGAETQTLYVVVENVDKHYKQSKEAGAHILQEPEDMFYGDRRYGAADPEGHHWYFAQRTAAT